MSTVRKVDAFISYCQFIKAMRLLMSKRVTTNYWLQFCVRGIVMQLLAPTIQGLLAVSLWLSAVTPLRLVGEFDSQVRHLLQHEMLTRDEIANLSTVFKDLENTLQTRWPGCEVSPLGSFVTGLASRSSDADCMVSLPHHHQYDVVTDRHLVAEAARLLQTRPDLYNHIRPKINTERRIPLLKFNYVPTNRNCDVNFISNLALYNTQMMAYYFSLDEKFLSLAAILKLWSKIQGLRRSEALASNTLNLLIIFYLQQEKLVPPFFLLQRHLPEIECANFHWETRFARIVFNVTVKPGVYELMGGFFQYYSKFEFEDYVVSPLAGRAIRKTKFELPHTLPHELARYVTYLSTPRSIPFNTNTKMCVQDVIEQRRNTADVSDEKADNFISHARFAARMFDIVPKDMFLRVLLTKHAIRFNVTLVEDSYVIRRLNECFNSTLGTM